MFEVSSDCPDVLGGVFPVSLGSWLNASLVGKMCSAGPLEDHCAHPLLRLGAASCCLVSSRVGLPSGDAHLWAVALWGGFYWVLREGLYIFAGLRGGG